MQITVQFTPAAELQADWLVLPLFEDEALTGRALEIDEALKGAISRLIQAGDIATN
jgi:hypothetical protein